MYFNPFHLHFGTVELMRPAHNEVALAAVKKLVSVSPMAARVDCGGMEGPKAEPALLTGWGFKVVLAPPVSVSSGGVWRTSAQ